MVDAATKAEVAKIGVLKTKAGPRDGADWVTRLKEEYTSIIKYVTANKESGTDWFRQGLLYHLHTICNLKSLELVEFIFMITTIYEYIL